jgi:imidazolonepropionase-like amidohydrolase
VGPVGLARRGAGKAIIATARTFLGNIYQTLKNKRVFEDFPNAVSAEKSSIIGGDIHHRGLPVTRHITRRSLLLALVGSITMSLTAYARQAPSPARETHSDILISNVRIFDGVSDQLTQSNLLIEDRKIKRISSTPIAAPPGAQVIDGGGRVLMPGLTDAHWHMTVAPNPPEQLTNPGLMYANTVAEARRTLMRGFTTVHDMAGPTFGIKEAIDSGVIPGPRVYPSGALISQTSGHGDFAPPWQRPKELGGQPSREEELGFFTVADGVPEVLAAVRAQLKKGASQIKLAAGGGVISSFDPLDVTQYTPEELRAAVQAASDWGTYVAVHVYTPRAIRRALDAGAKSIEHGHLADEPTIELIAARDAWLSTQPWEPDDFGKPVPSQLAKGAPLIGAWERVLKWAKQYEVKVAFGTDLLSDPSGTYKQNIMLTRLAKIYSNVEVLKIATSGNCELFAVSGERNPYKEAKQGVLQEGAWADMLLVNGDPLKDINVLKDYEGNFVVIIKDGKIYKHTLN